jgi:hypothetical protein
VRNEKNKLYRLYLRGKTGCLLSKREWREIYENLKLFRSRTVLQTGSSGRPTGKDSEGFFFRVVATFTPTWMTSMFITLNNV